MINNFVPSGEYTKLLFPDPRMPIYIGFQSPWFMAQLDYPLRFFSLCISYDKKQDMLNSKIALVYPNLV
ncbi:MAG: hypothetical protein JXP36_05220 [Bacteroidales bacterium]|nr:hypothetical protein [Bacteroidales bacterium]